MEKIYYHKHHIIPKHAGGTDEPSNIIRVNVAMHAFLHKVLFEEYGRWEDQCAYLGLSGSISSQEVIRMAQSMGSKGNNRRLGTKQPDSFKAKLSADRQGADNPFFGKTHNQETKIKQGAKRWLVTSPTGIVYTPVGLNGFCKEHGLDQRHMSKNSKTGKTHKGWTCKILP